MFYFKWLQQRTFFQNECGGKHKKHAYVKTKCYIAIVKFQLKVVRHLVITVTQSVGDETFINLLELESNTIVFKFGYKLIWMIAEWLIKKYFHGSFRL